MTRDLFDPNREKMTKASMAERRKLGRKTTPPKGYAAKPGTGPAGEFCRTCIFLVRKEMSKVYLKCWLTRGTWTGGGGSDIRASFPACRFWRAIPPELTAAEKELKAVRKTLPTKFGGPEWDRFGVLLTLTEQLEIEARK